MDLGLKGKNVVITGGASGLGKTLVETLADEGANVFFSYHSGDPQEILEKYQSAPTKVKAFQADLSKSAEVKAFFQAAEREFSTLEILINNAAVWPKNFVANISEEEWDWTFALNLKAVFLLSQLFVTKAMENRKAASILNINSQAAFHGSTSGHAHYAASKAGLVAFQSSLAREVAENGIQVNGLAIGLMNTPMIQKQYSENQLDYLARVPVKRLAKTQEIANLAAFLVSEKNSYMTGATVDISGGMLMR